MTREISPSNSVPLFDAEGPRRHRPPTHVTRDIFPPRLGPPRAHLCRHDLQLPLRGSVSLRTNSPEGRLLEKFPGKNLPPRRSLYTKTRWTYIFTCMRNDEAHLRAIVAQEISRLLREDPELKRSDVIPPELDDVDPVLAKVLVKAGERDRDPNDDVVSVSPASFPAGDLHPSQTTMDLNKAIGMALSMCISGRVGGDLGAVVSSDNHIMDGHHRWAATTMVDPGASVSGYVADLPGSELVPVLNILTKGLFGKSKGNPGTGAIGDFTPDAVRSRLEGFVEKGTPGRHGMKPEVVRHALEKRFGGVEDGIEAMASNVEALDKSVPGWAPDRVQMPVIDPREVPRAAAYLSAGKVDINPPYAAVTKLAAKKAGITTSESVQRWQRLAGIIKVKDNL